MSCMVLRKNGRNIFGHYQQKYHARLSFLWILSTLCLIYSFKMFRLQEKNPTKRNDLALYCVLPILFIKVWSTSVSAHRLNATTRALALLSNPWVPMPQDQRKGIRVWPMINIVQSSGSWFQNSDVVEKWQILLPTFTCRKNEINT